MFLDVILARSLAQPVTPMRRMNENWLPRQSIHPPPLYPSTGENERMHFLVLVHTELQIAV